MEHKKVSIPSNRGNLPDHAELKAMRAVWTVSIPSKRGQPPDSLFILEASGSHKSLNPSKRGNLRTSGCGRFSRRPQLSQSLKRGNLPDIIR